MRRFPFRVRLAVVSCAVVAATLCLGWYQNAGPGYYAELNAIRVDLQRIPQVESLSLSWVDENDFPLLHNLEHISARIKIAGKGEMVFTGLSRDSARDARHLYLVSVGPYRIRTRGEGYVGAYEAATGKPVLSEFLKGTADIGPAGEFAHIFPFEIPNIQTAIAHYEEILSVAFQP